MIQYRVMVCFCILVIMIQNLEVIILYLWWSLSIGNNDSISGNGMYLYAIIFQTLVVMILNL